MLVLIVSHGSLQFMFFKILQTKYKSDVVKLIINGVPDSELITFKFEKKDFESNIHQINWIDSDEFRYEENMYDIIKQEIIGDSIYLYCIRDSNETQLYSYFNKFLQNLSEEDPDKLKDITSINIFISQLYSNSISSEHNKPFELSKNQFANLITNTLDGEESLNTPPPRA